MEANKVSEKIQIFISARNLKDLDVFSKSDPYVQISFRRDFTQNQYTILGRTQTVQNNLNPNYRKSFTLDYIFESRQDIKFEVFDDDNNGDKDEYIGTVQTTVGFLMGAKAQTSILQLKNAKKGNQPSGKLIVRCELLNETSCKKQFQLQFRAEKLYNTDSYFDFWDKSDPYLKFLKIRDDNTYLQVDRTEIIENNLNPQWNPLIIQQARLVNPIKHSFKVQVWDWEKSGKDQFIGETFITIEQLKSQTRFQLANPKVKKPGTLILTRFKKIKKPTFVDYLRGGLQLNMIVAIDFTGSNGNPQQPSSLHYIDPNIPNQYQQAILSISGILMNYDSDKRIPAFGFGARINFNGTQDQNVNHCFPLSGNSEKLEAEGIDHLLHLYRQALNHVILQGPTYFSPLIRQISKLASACRQQGSNTYQILLILTDGQIHDMKKTVDLIIQGANLPLSIIIVGVGDAEFDKMEQLDGDRGLSGSGGKSATRDIVQFIPFRDVKLNGDLLAKELLAELPGQVVSYMTHIGKQPGQYFPINMEELILNPNPNKKQVA